VIRHERLLVTNISLAVDHPYHYLVSLAKAVDRTLAHPTHAIGTHTPELT
jgi:hypothetical protein